MRKYFGFLLLVLLPFQSYSQQNLSADELFVQARTAAFNEKDYPKSISLARQALQISPNYTDISVFLGRLYTWSDDVASARAVFEELSSRNVQDEDYFIAYASLEYWNDNNTKAVEITDKGLSYHPQSEALWLLKAKAYNAAKEYAESEKAIKQLLVINPKNTDAMSLAVRINDLASKNA